MNSMYLLTKMADGALRICTILAVRKCCSPKTVNANQIYEKLDHYFLNLYSRQKKTNNLTKNR